MKPDVVQFYCKYQENISGTHVVAEVFVGEGLVRDGASAVATRPRPQATLLGGRSRAGQQVSMTRVADP